MRREGEAVAAGAEIHHGLRRNRDVGTAPPPILIELAQKNAPLAVRLRLRETARRNRRAVARPCDAKKIAVRHAADVGVGDRRQGRSVEDRDFRRASEADRQAPAGRIDRDAKGLCPASPPRLAVRRKSLP